MGRKLLVDFYTLEELVTCTSIPPKVGNKNPRPLVGQDKMACLLGMIVILMYLINPCNTIHENQCPHTTCFSLFATAEVRRVFPAGWNEERMMHKLNQAFIDYRNKKKNIIS